MNITLTNQRDRYWDSVKAVLIFLVILGHVMQYYIYQGDNHINFWADPIFKGIYIFHMPLFMLISGYFAALSLNNRGFSIIPRYLKRLALPCLGAGIYLFILRLYHHNPISPTRIWGDCTSLWFLIVILECLVWYLIFVRFGVNLLTKIILFVLPIIFALNVHHLGYKISLLWPHTQHFTYMWPFFIIGSYIQKHNLITELTDYKRIGGALIVLFVIFFTIFDAEWYVYRTPLNQTWERLGIHLIRTVAAITGCGAFLCIIKLTSGILQSAFIQKIGKATLAIYVLQSIVLNILRPYIPDGLGYIEAFIISMVILVCLFYFYRITRKIPVFSYLAYGENHK